MSIVRRVLAAPAVKADLMVRVAQGAVAVLVARVARADRVVASNARTRPVTSNAEQAASSDVSEEATCDDRRNQDERQFHRRGKLIGNVFRLFF